MSTISSLRPPPGVKPNFVNPESRANQLRGAAIACPAIAAVFVVFRIYARVYITRKLWWDDYSAVVALILSIPLSVLCAQWPNTGGGRHLWDVPATLLVPMVKHSLLLFLLYPLSMFFVKISILLLYLRIFDTVQYIKIVSWITIFLFAVFTLITVLLHWYNCRPREKLWYSFIPGSCYDYALVNVSTAIVNIIFDIMVFVLPMKAVKDLHLPIRQKFTVMGVFATGSFLCVVSVVRMCYWLKFHREGDVTWIASPIIVWSLVELNIGLACGCLPALRHYLTRVFPSVFGTGNHVSSDRISFFRIGSKKQGPASSYLEELDSETPTAAESAVPSEAILMRPNYRA